MRVCMCPVRQFNVQLYVEKVFIAQKTSEDRGGKVRKRVKDTELFVVGLLEKELGGRARWKVGRRDRRWNLRGGEDTSPDRVIVARQEKKRRDMIQPTTTTGQPDGSNSQPVSREDGA